MITDPNTLRQLESTRQRRVTLDFSPFEAGIAALEPARLEALVLLLASAPMTDLRALIDAGELTYAECVLGYVERIRRFDGPLQSILALNPDALHQAEARDRERQSGTVTGPLHGMAILLKDNIDTAPPMPTTAGAAVLMNTTASRDAFLVSRLADAGAVILGKTNLSEWAFWMSSEGASGYSYVGGQTRNPHGKFDVGGSSSGSGAAVAAGFGAAAIGTETSGSISSPTSANALAGLKPSIGLVSRQGVVPIVDVLDTPGPMTRTVADTAALMGALAAYDASDPEAGHEALRPLFGRDFRADLNPDALKGVRVGILRYNLHVPGATNLISAEIRGLISMLAARSRVMKAALERAGAVPVMLPLIPLQPQDWDLVGVLNGGFRDQLNAYLAGRDNLPPYARTLADIIAYNDEDPAERAPYNQAMLLHSQASTFDPAGYRALGLKMRAAADAYLTNLMAQSDVQIVGSIGAFASMYYAAAGWPAVCVPVGRVKRTGQPFNATLFAPYASEPRLLAAGLALEQAVAAV